MIICQRSVDPDDHLQEASPSGWSFARGRPIRMIICKRPAHQDDHLHWSLVVACCWSLFVVGRCLSLVIVYRWRCLLLAAVCHWSWFVVGRCLLLVVDCRWSLVLVGRCLSLFVIGRCLSLVAVTTNNDQQQTTTNNTTPRENWLFVFKTALSATFHD